jgi:signal transduction histidine kinase
MMNPENVLRILSVGKSEDNGQDILKHLQCLGYSIQSAVVRNVDEFQKKLDTLPWNLVVFDSEVDHFSAQEALLRTKKKCFNLPFILISNGIGEEEVANLIRAGAEDVVLSVRPQRLVQVVSRVLQEREIKEKEARMSKLADKAFAAREQMLAIVSHDIKNPLSVIQLEAQMLLKVAERNVKNLFSKDVQCQATRILKTTEKLKNLIADLLDKNKTEDDLSSLKKTDCDVSIVFKEVYDTNLPLLKQKKLSVNTTFPSELILKIDKNKMFQVLTNLLSNAIKFSPENGLINLGIEESPNEIIFSVSDNGPGIKSSELNLVFEKYWTGCVAGRSGTGLGLFICKTIVEAHGGHIFVENQKTSGSHFWFSIPKYIDTKRNILVIDDDDDLREVISWALTSEGFAVQSHADPKEALEGLKNGRHTPQLIVLDYQMDSMKGCEFLKCKNDIKLLGIKDCPVVMISASPEEIPVMATSDYFKDILTKPLDLETLVENVKRYVS